MAVVLRRADQGFDQSRLRLAIVVLVALKIAGIIAIVDPLGWEAFDLPKSLFSRATAWLLVGLLALAFWRYGIEIFPRSRLNIAITVLAAAVAAAGISAENHYIAAFGDQYRYLGLTFFADMLVLYVAVAVAFRAPRDWVFLGAGIAEGALISLGYAAVQAAGEDPLRWADVSRIRPFSFFGNPDLFGHFLSLSLGVAVGLVAFGSNWLARVVGVGSMAIGLASAGVVATRGTLVGIGAVLVAAPVMFVLTRGLRFVVILRLAAGATVAAVALGLLVFYSPLGDRARATIAGPDISTRLLLYASATQAIADRPLLGWGPDSFSVAYPHYRNAGQGVFRGNEPESSAHAWPLQAGVTTGLVGLLALVSLIASGTVFLFRACLTGATSIAAPALLGWFAYWAHAAVSVGSISIDWYPWVVLGTAAALAGRSETRPVTRRIPWPAVAVLITCSLLAAAAELVPGAANRNAYTAALATFRQDVDMAIASAQSAVRLDPGRALYWKLLGVAHEMRQSWREANDAYRRAAELSPHMTHYRLDLARAQARQARAGDESGGGGAAAIETARNAVRADPNNWEAWSVLGETQNMFGQPDAALESIATAIPLYRRNQNNDDVAVDASTKVTDLVKARALLEEMVAMKETAALRVALAQVALRQHDSDAALQNARRAFALDSRNADAQRIITALAP